MLDITLSQEVNKDGVIYCYRVFNEKNNTLMNNGYKIPFYSIDATKENFNISIVIMIRNVGLSTANRIQIVLKQLISVEGLSNLSDLKSQYVKNFYEKIHTCNYTRYEQTNENENDVVLIEDEEWFITPEFNLSNNGEGFALVVDFSNIKRDYLNILELRYEDVYSNKYVQKMYFFFNSSNVGMLPLSKPFERS